MKRCARFFTVRPEEPASLNYEMSVGVDVCLGRASFLQLRSVSVRYC